MNKVTLYDQSHDRTIELLNSSTITVGRGFFECNDKRVSRKHGEITVLEAKIKIKACHTNPIFYKVSGSEQNQILNKDSEIELKNSDKFSLLPNSEYEYEIKILEGEHEVDDPAEDAPVATSSTTTMRIRNAMEINENLEAGNMAMSLSQIVGSSTNVNNRADDDLDRTPSPDMLVPPSDLVESSNNSRKRSHEGVTEGETDDAKRSKTTETADTSSASDSAQPSTSDDKSNLPSVTIKPDPDAVPTSSNAAVSSSSSVPNIKPDPDGPSDSTSAAVKAENAPSSAVKTENTPTSSNPNLPTAPLLRPSCEYGIRCYRNTADHTRDFAHPSDADYRRPTYPPAPATAPQCPWGTSCYRRNPDHFRNLQHPSSNVYSTQPPPPAPQPQPIAPRMRIAAIVPRNHDDHNDTDDEDESDDFDDSDADVNFPSPLNDGSEIDEASDLDDEASDPEFDDYEENNLEE